MYLWATKSSKVLSYLTCILKHVLERPKNILHVLIFRLSYCFMMSCKKFKPEFPCIAEYDVAEKNDEEDLDTGFVIK